jgi:hypothetical protein
MCHVGRQGRTVSEVFAVAVPDAAEVVELITNAVDGEGGHHVTSVAPDVLQISRVYRPTWATVSGWIFTIGLLGFGFWLFLIKRTETATVTLTREPGGMRASISGLLTLETLAVLREILTTPSTVTLGDGPDHDHDHDHDHDQDLDLTVLHGRPPQPSPPASAPVAQLVLDTGQRIALARLNLVGRNPEAKVDGERDAQLVPVDDPTSTVSKTHFAVGVEPSGDIWIEDRYATNGTAVGSTADSAVALAPGRRRFVLGGSVVRFGERTAQIVAAVGAHRQGSSPPS